MRATLVGSGIGSAAAAPAVGDFEEFDPRITRLLLVAAERWAYARGAGDAQAIAMSSPLAAMPRGLATRRLLCR